MYCCTEVYTRYTRAGDHWCTHTHTSNTHTISNQYQWYTGAHQCGHMWHSSFILHTHDIPYCTTSHVPNIFFTNTKLKPQHWKLQLLHIVQHHWCILYFKKSTPNSLSWRWTCCRTQGWSQWILRITLGTRCCFATGTALQSSHSLTSTTGCCFAL